MNPNWASQVRDGLDLTDETGDTRLLLMQLDNLAQALAATDDAAIAALLAAAVTTLSPHMSNPISVAHHQITQERLITKLGAERYDQLTAEGARLDYDQAVALARAELDRVIADASSR
jgi:hypothetical protein